MDTTYQYSLISNWSWSCLQKLYGLGVHAFAGWPLDKSLPLAVTKGLQEENSIMALAWAGEIVDLAFDPFLHLFFFSPPTLCCSARWREMKNQTVPPNVFITCSRSKQMFFFFVVVVASTAK
jgi:hypothetical protein